MSGNFSLPLQEGYKQYQINYLKRKQSRITSNYLEEFLMA
jgi:hypothetical protein